MTDYSGEYRMYKNVRIRVRRSQYKGMYVCEWHYPERFDTKAYITREERSARTIREIVQTKMWTRAWPIRLGLPAGA